MGIRLFSSSSYDTSSSTELPLPNPNPKNFKIVKFEVIGDYLLMLVNYPDCTNYEGHKVLLYQASLEELMAQKTLDPHFCQHKKFKSPIARFEPTKRGWDMGLVLMSTIHAS